LSDFYTTPRPKAAAYQGTKGTRNRRQQAFINSRPVDEDRLITSRDRCAIRLECRHLRRNNAIVAGVCDRFADHVVGPHGIVPQAQTASEDWNKSAEQFFAEWSKVADHRQRLSFRELQRLTITGRLLDGDLGFVLVDNGQLHPIEADRIANPKNSKSPNNVDGIQLSKSGIPISYFVHTRDKNGYIKGDSYRRLEARNFIHASQPTRFDQLRGIPEIAPILSTLSDFGRLQDEVLNRSVLDALHAWAITTNDGPAEIGNLGARNATPNDESNPQKHEYFDGGQTYYLRPGEKVESLASNTPNNNFIPYSQMLLRVMGASISLPYEFMMMDFTGGSFSASRAALMSTYRTFAGWQSWLRDSLLQRTWNWRIAKAVRDGDLAPAPLDYRGISEWYRVNWVPPRFDWIDPKKEISAEQDAFDMGFESHSSICNKRGTSSDDVLRQKAKDIASAKRVADDVNAEHGTELTWQDLINVQRPGQAVINKPEPAAKGNNNE